MPKQAFLNLPDAKRARLEQAMRTEFARYPFTAASVDRIVQAAGVSKGSFYQYFVDKADAYAHVVGEVLRQQVDALPGGGGAVPLRQLLTELVTRSRAAESSDRLGWVILARAYADDAPAIASTVTAISGVIHQAVVDELTTRIGSGELRPDLDLDASAWFLEHVLMGLGSYLTTRFGIATDRLVEKSGGLDAPEITAVVEAVHDMIARALVVEP